MAPQRLSTVQPLNRTLQGPEYTELVEYEVGANATVADMVAGTLVIKDAVDGSVKEAGLVADNVLGVIEVRSGKLLTDTHAVGDPVTIITHAGARVVLLVSSGGGAITQGVQLSADVHGTVSITAGPIVAKALEGNAATTYKDRILCELIIAGDFA